MHHVAMSQAWPPLSAGRLEAQVERERAAAHDLDLDLVLRDETLGRDLPVYAARREGIWNVTIVTSVVSDRYDDRIQQREHGADEDLATAITQALSRIYDPEDITRMLESLR